MTTLNGESSLLRSASTSNQGTKKHSNNSSKMGATSSDPNEENFKTKLLEIGKKNWLTIAIVIGALLGTIIGISINSPIQKLQQPDRYTAILIIGFPGELLLRGLKMLILPLITFSLIVGLSKLDKSVSGKIGARAVVYYMSTTAIAAILGLILVSIIRPGVGMAAPESIKETEPVKPVDSFFDIIR